MGKAYLLFCLLFFCRLSNLAISIVAFVANLGS